MRRSRAFVDALEGATARLLVGEEAFEIPVGLLPEGAREGTWLEITVAIVSAPPDDTERRRRRLAADDPGDDIEL